jgi:hypothetical protein
VQGSLDLFVSLPNADPRIRFRRPSTVRAALLLLALLSGRDDRPGLGLFACLRVHFGGRTRISSIATSCVPKSLRMMH